MTAPATFNRDQYDREILFRAREQARRMAVEVEQRTRRQLVYDAAYAARFAALRSQMVPVDLASFAARRDALAAVASREG